MAVRLADYSRDRDDTGRLTITRSWHVDTEEEIDQVVADNPTYNGLGLKDDHAETWDPDTIEGGFRVDLRYEGVDSENGRIDPEDAKWNFDPAFEKEPVEKHHSVSYLIENYDGKEDPKTGRVTFPRLISRQKALSEGAEFSRSAHWYEPGGESSEEVDNPLYGLNESGYIVMLGSASCRYNTTDPSQAQRGVGRLFDELPYNAPDYGIEDDRNWLKAPAQVEELEPVDGERWFAVTEIYLLSEIGGWPPAVYKLIEV